MLHSNSQPVPDVEFPFTAPRATFGLLLVAWSDFLLYRHALGCSLALLLLALGAASILLTGARKSPRLLARDMAMLVAVTLPLVEDVSPLSIAIGVLGTAAVVLNRVGGLTGSWCNRLARLAQFVACTPAALIRDSRALKASAFSTRLVAALRRMASGWGLPAGLGLIFLLLFAVANPLIERHVALLDPTALLAILSGPRVIFWLISAILRWPFLAPRLPRSARPSDAGAPPLNSSTGLLTNGLPVPVLVRSLVVCNAVFAVETVLDIAYLWRDSALPVGMSYASYAHRGAYPLMVAALLAGAFVLLAFDGCRDGGSFRLPRALATLWIGQTIFLVVSSIFRLDLYVSVYALSYWRVAAFIWMGLVSIGLALLLARILLDRSIGWLVAGNAIALGLTLYAVCFVDVAGLIADFNVNHSREMGGDGKPVDAGYLAELGPEALPARLRLATRVALSRGWSVEDRVAGEARSYLAANGVATSGLQASEPDWRSWTYRRRRLLDALAAALPAPG